MAVLVYRLFSLSFLCVHGIVMQLPSELETHRLVPFPTYRLHHHP